MVHTGDLVGKTLTVLNDTSLTGEVGFHGTAPIAKKDELSLTLPDIYTSLLEYGLVDSLPTIPDTNSITLNFMNKTSTPSINVVLLQKNINVAETTAMAWTTIPFSNIGDNVKINYSPNLQIQFVSQSGNISEKITAAAGNKFLASGTNTIALNGNAGLPSDIELENTTGSTIAILIYRNGKVIYRKDSITNGQTVVVELKPTFFADINKDISQGEIIEAGDLANFNTEISLIGIASSDVIVSGGGTDPYQFSLDNVVFA